MAQYIYIWRFTVVEGKRPGFEALYGPSGDWVTLFRRSPDWLGTELMTDPANAGTYLTIDRWSSRAVLEAFRASVAGEWEEIDRRGEELTSGEELIGEFEAADPDPDLY